MVAIAPELATASQGSASGNSGCHCSSHASLNVPVELLAAGSAQGTSRSSSRWKSRDRARAALAQALELNPLLHYLDIVRAPLLGAHQEVRHWIVVLVLTAIGWVLAVFAMRQYRSRVPYWV